MMKLSFCYSKIEFYDVNFVSFTSVEIQTQSVAYDELLLVT